MAVNHVVLVAPDAHRVVLNKVFEANGHGPETFMAKASPNGEMPQTVWYCNYTNMTPSQEERVRSLRHTLPTLPLDENNEPEQWGENGWPEEQDALDAIASFALYVCDDPTKTQQQSIDDILSLWGVVKIENEIEL